NGSHGATALSSPDSRSSGRAIGRHHDRRDCTARIRALEPPAFELRTHSIAAWSAVRNLDHPHGFAGSDADPCGARTRWWRSFVRNARVTAEVGFRCDRIETECWLQPSKPGAEEALQ